MNKVAPISHDPRWQQLFGGQLCQYLKGMQSFEHDSRDLVSTGCKPLDEALPGSVGIPRGSLIEFINDNGGGSAAVFATLVAREAACDGGLVAIVDRALTFYPPAAAAWGLDIERALVIRPTTEKDELWALDQVMRCAHVAAVIGWPQKIDSITFRRFQLAVERSGCMGVLVRPASAVREPSWADYRIMVSSQESEVSLTDVQPRWHLNLKVLRCRGNIRKECIKLQVDDQTGEIHEAHVSHLATQLAHPKIVAKENRNRASA